jgi:hypothetical protein
MVLSTIKNMNRLTRSILLLFSRSAKSFTVLERYYFATLERRFSLIDPAGMIKLRSLLIPQSGNIRFPLNRFGSENDGGYLLFDGIEPNTELLSFGIGDNLDFEQDIAPRVNRILAFDGSINNLPKSVPGLEFLNKYVGSQTSADTVSINEILSEVVSERLILKIDIEGAEWKVFGELNDVQYARFDQIVGEFHGLGSIKNNGDLIDKIQVLETLHSRFTLVNSHPNNWSPYRVINGVPIPDVVELTFLRNEIYSNFSNDGTEIETGNLNSPCNPAKHEYII